MNLLTKQLNLAVFFFECVIHEPETRVIRATAEDVLRIWDKPVGKSYIVV